MHMPFPNTDVAPRRPTFLAAAVLAPLAAYLGIYLISRQASGTGGDGLQGFWEIALLYPTCLLVSVVCGVLGVRRKEQPRWLLWVALVLWLPTLKLIGVF
jgi:hypothetical protein